MPDPGGLPLGTLEYLTFSRFFNVAGAPFRRPCTWLRRGRDPGRHRALNVPAGWTVDAAEASAPSRGCETTVTFKVTPAAGAVNTNFKISALSEQARPRATRTRSCASSRPSRAASSAGATGASSTSWLKHRAVGAPARPLRRDPVDRDRRDDLAPVDVHNWSTRGRGGRSRSPLPAGVTADATSQAVLAVGPGGDTTVNFTLERFTDPTLPGLRDQRPRHDDAAEDDQAIATSYSAPASSASENLTMRVVPTTTIPAAGSAPVIDGQEDAGGYTGPALDLSRKWSGGACSPAGTDCGTAGHPGDADVDVREGRRQRRQPLLLRSHPRRLPELRGHAAGCVAHWLADSAEILIDPRGNSSQTNFDTGTTFKLGVFPFTNDPVELQRQRRQRAVLGA